MKELNQDLRDGLLTKSFILLILHSTFQSNRQCWYSKEYFSYHFYHILLWICQMSQYCWLWLWFMCNLVVGSSNDSDRNNNLSYTEDQGNMFTHEVVMWQLKHCWTFRVPHFIFAFFLTLFPFNSDVLWAPFFELFVLRVFRIWCLKYL